VELFENKSKLIIDSLSVQFYLIDKQYNIVDCNKALVEHVKQSKETIIGTPCYRLTHKSDIPC